MTSSYVHTYWLVGGLYNVEWQVLTDINMIQVHRLSTLSLNCPIGRFRVPRLSLRAPSVPRMSPAARMSPCAEGHFGVPRGARSVPLRANSPLPERSIAATVSLAGFRMSPCKRGHLASPCVPQMTRNVPLCFFVSNDGFPVRVCN